MKPRTPPTGEAKRVMVVFPPEQVEAIHEYLESHPEATMSGVIRTGTIEFIESKLKGSNK